MAAVNSLVGGGQGRGSHSNYYRYTLPEELGVVGQLGSRHEAHHLTQGSSEPCPGEIDRLAIAALDLTQEEGDL